MALAAFCFSMTVEGAVGVFRVRHGPGVPSGYAEGHRGAEHYLRDAGPTNSTPPSPSTASTRWPSTARISGFDGYLDIGLYDTMEDLFVNFIGAVTFSVIGYFYIKHRGRESWRRPLSPPCRRTRTRGSLPEGDPGAAGIGITTKEAGTKVPASCYKVNRPAPYRIPVQRRYRHR